MSIRHCIAGVVLVVFGGLAVHAYQDQPERAGSSATDPIVSVETRRAEIRKAKQRIEELNGEQRRLSVRLKYANQVLDRLNREQDRDFAEGSDITAPTLVLADEPQPAPNSAEKKQVFAYPLQAEARPVGTPTTAPSTATPSPSSVGRYQFVDRVLSNGNKSGLMYDTTTGHCWSLVGDEWKDLGSPSGPDNRIKASDFRRAEPPQATAAGGTLDLNFKPAPVDIYTPIPGPVPGPQAVPTGSGTLEPSRGTTGTLEPAAAPAQEPTLAPPQANPTDRR